MRRRRTTSYSRRHRAVNRRRLRPATSTKPKPTEPPEVYQWTACVREFVSAPSIWLCATPHQEQAYLKHCRTKHLRAERVEGLRLMELEKEAEEEGREMEEDERACAAALRPPPA
ncbi:hypothetical protein D1007_29576 [Hordeum vulgare]|nr:hypothetical protein D1007_29576 [Hordeum vulgare]